MPRSLTDFELVRLARDLGLRAVVLKNHHTMTADRAQIVMAEMGAIMECPWLTHFSGAAGAINFGKLVPVNEGARLIQSVGAEHFIITSDFGQEGNPRHPDGMRAFMAALLEAGLTSAEIDLVARRNPARLLGLEP